MEWCNIKKSREAAERASLWQKLFDECKSGGMYAQTSKEEPIMEITFTNLDQEDTIEVSYDSEDDIFTIIDEDADELVCVSRDLLVFLVEATA